MIPIDTKKYCVYLTSYKGNKLPQFYIGSSTVERIQNGYRGSVKSKKYKSTFINEVTNNPHLFTTKIICFFQTQIEAVEKECHFQVKLNVVKSDMYINMSFARNFGWCGMDTKGVNSPVYGKTWKKTAEQKKRCAEACRKAFSKPEHKHKMSVLRKGKIPKSLEQIEILMSKRKKIRSLYITKPELVTPYGHVSGNGKLYTYEKAFSEEYYKIFGFTCSKSLQNIVSVIK